MPGRRTLNTKRYDIVTVGGGLGGSAIASAMADAGASVLVLEASAEFRAGRLGTHPHVVSVFALGQHEGQPYIVTELMGGGDVEGLLEGADGQLPTERDCSGRARTASC